MQYWRWHPTPGFLPGKPHGWRSLEGCSPWGRKESGTTEQLHFHFSGSCIGEGSGNPLQGSCLENLRDGGAWWAAVYGVTQSRTRLKRLSSNSSVQYYSLQHWTLLPSSVTSVTGHFFHFGSTSSFFLELFLHSSPVLYWTPTNPRGLSSSVISFCLFLLLMEFPRQEH